MRVMTAGVAILLATSPVSSANEDAIARCDGDADCIKIARSQKLPASVLAEVRASEREWARKAAAARARETETTFHSYTTKVGGRTITRYCTISVYRGDTETVCE